MAELKIKADSGGGTVSFKGPATTTGNAAVQLTLPVNDGDASQYLQTNGSGVLSWNTVTIPAGGKILQYKVAKKTNTTTSTSSSRVEISSDFRTTLTPTAADSIIVVTAYLYVTISDANAYGFTIVRNTAADFSGTSTRILDPDSIGSEDDGIATEYVNAVGHMSPVVINAYETASNTTARTYSPFWRAGGGTMKMNTWDPTYLGVSTMTVMEVSA